MAERNTRSGCKRDEYSEDSDNGLLDMDLLVEGKKVKVSSGVLARNSSVFKTLITNARSAQLDFDDFDLADVSTQRLKLEIPNTKYKDMKLMVASLQSVVDIQIPSGEEALRILPLAEQYQVKKLIKACGKALQMAIISLQEKHGRGHIPVYDIMKYLSAAETHNLDKVKSICIEELSLKPDATRRRQILKEKHVGDGTKLKIFEKLYQRMEDEYEIKLKRLRIEMEEKHQEADQRRKDFFEKLESWKDDLKREVDDIRGETIKIHEDLISELHQKKVIDGIEKSFKQTADELLLEQQHINDRMQSLIETMETNKVLAELEASKMRDDLEEAQRNIVINIESIATRFRSRIDGVLRVCYFALEARDAFNASYTLEESVNDSIEVLEEKVRQADQAKVAHELEKQSHQKTRSELIKMKMKEQEINTWLRWAKPDSTDQVKCMCFRHMKCRWSE